MTLSCWLKPLKPRQNGRHFAIDIFKLNYFNAGCFILIQMLESRLKFHWSLFPRDNNNPALIQIWLGVEQATSHYLNRWWLDYWRTYASLASIVNLLATQHILPIEFMCQFCQIDLRWLPQNLTGKDKPATVKVMTWCHQATSHNQEQYRQATRFTWPNVNSDICRHMASLGHNVLTHPGLVTPCDVKALDHHWLNCDMFDVNPAWTNVAL